GPPPPSSRISTSAAAPGVAAARQSEPAKLGRYVRGELDWIVMKALAKERERRHEDATARGARRGGVGRGGGAAVGGGGGGGGRRGACPGPGASDRRAAVAVVPAAQVRSQE